MTLLDFGIHRNTFSVCMDLFSSAAVIAFLDLDIHQKALLYAWSLLLPPRRYWLYDTQSNRAPNSRCSTCLYKQSFWPEYGQFEIRIPLGNSKACHSHWLSEPTSWIVGRNGAEYCRTLAGKPVKNRDCGECSFRESERATGHYLREVILWTYSTRAGYRGRCDLLSMLDECRDVGSFGTPGEV